MKKLILFPYLFLAFFLLSCKEEPEHGQTSIDYNQRLSQFLEREFARDLKDSPMLQTRLGKKDDYGSWDDYSHKRHAKDRELAKERLDFLQDSIEPNRLDTTHALDYRLYRRELENEIADYDYRFYNYPVNQLFGVHTSIPAFLINMHQIESLADAEAYLSRLEKIPEVFQQVEEAIQLREFNGIVPPRFVFEHAVPASRNVIAGEPFEASARPSVLLKDFNEKVEQLEISTEKQEDLSQRARMTLKEHVEPAYQQLIANLENQRQRATEDAGAWKFPKGEAFYGNALKRYTTTNLTAAEIHEIGLQEVARIHREMELILETLDFQGSLQDFFQYLRTEDDFYLENSDEGRSSYLAQATAIIDTMRNELESLFLIQPKADIVVKAVEPFREQSAGKAFYQQPALDGSRPGTFYVNLHDMEAMPTYQLEALAYHEGIPGHHMQIAIAQELDELPMFRKLSLQTAYVEGWGLYAEFLPKEMGFYEDPYSDFGRLAMELWRSIRLVVDTGIHYHKWSREKGITYYMENSPNPEGDVIKMVERHIVMPGQATAYKIGMLKILELREKAQDALGEAFDLREFHQVVLANGALPLDILEEVVTDWIARKEQAGS